MNIEYWKLKVLYNQRGDNYMQKKQFNISVILTIDSVTGPTWSPEHNPISLLTKILRYYVIILSKFRSLKYHFNVLEVRIRLQELGDDLPPCRH